MAPPLVGLALAALLLGCHESEATTPSAAERYPFLYEVRDLIESGPEAWNALPYERLLLRREGCFGMCPRYEVELRRGGAARYVGRGHAPREGEHEGDAGLYAYALLCAALEDLGLERMRERYAASWTDDEAIVIEWERDGRTGRVSDYGRQAPPAFQAYRALFDELVEQIEWTPVGKER